MTHELKLLFQTLQQWQKQGKKSVFVSVVALEGSSYRKPGVRMIISEQGESVGAVSGGCVENEIERQARSVFKTGRAKVITYDGRFRIGCEGIIHILIEPVFLSDELLSGFEARLSMRKPFRLETWYYRDVGEYNGMGSVIVLNHKRYPVHPSFRESKDEKLELFVQQLEPLFRLFIFGAEHDAVALCSSATLLGWEVTVVASPEEEKTCDYFPGANSFIAPDFADFDNSGIDEHTAVVLMTHSFNKDVQYLMALRKTRPAYIGLLGSVSRRERVLSMLMEYSPDISVEFLEQIHGPAGLNIGAVGASEIAVSILAEILSTVRRKHPVPLSEKHGSVHG